jgi:aspartate/methionine/tyrosine aminotransferase
MKIADRMNLLGTETAFRVLQQIQNFPPERRKRVISFALGEPDFNTPEHIKQAGIRGIEQNHTHYVTSAGIPELREVIADFASKQRNIKITPDMITVFNSGKMTIGLSVLTCMNQGDEVIYPNPGYPIYESMIRTFGGKPVPALLREDDNWNYDTDRLRNMITDKTKMIVLNSPQNPTGGLLSKQNLSAIAEICLDNDLWVLSDEIYGEFVYDPNYEFHSITEIPGMQERTIILDGFSKYYAMTGWRLGYSISSPEIAKHMANWATNFISCAPHFVQDAGIAAMREGKTESDLMIKTFKERRDLICDLLNAIPGISVKKPRGAFYLFANVTEACKNLGLKDALAFQQFILDKADVAILARAFFGSRDPDERGEFVRFSYCVSTEDIINGCERMKAAVEGRPVKFKSANSADSAKDDDN